MLFASWAEKSFAFTDDATWFISCRVCSVNLHYKYILLNSDQHFQFKDLLLSPWFVVFHFPWFCFFNLWAIFFLSFFISFLFLRLETKQPWRGMGDSGNRGSILHTKQEKSCSSRFLNVIWSDAISLLTTN